MAKKCILVTDGTRDPKTNEWREDAQAVYRIVENYGYSFEIVHDDGIFCDGDKTGIAQLKLETQGPNWVRHSPEYLEKIADAEIIIISYSAAGKQFFDAAKQLKFLGIMRGGVENCDFEEAKKHGVTVAHCPGRACEPTAEMIIAHIMGANRGISYVNNRWKEGVDFDFRVLQTYMPKLMRESTVGLIGFGKIPKLVVQKMKSLGCKFVTYDPYLTPEQVEPYGVELVSLDELAARSDFVSISVILTPETTGMLNKEFFAKMKPSAFFINCARGGFVVDADLQEALRNGTIRGAALDVFNEEPLPYDSPYHQLENCVCTPHLAGGAGDGVILSAEMMMAEVERWIKGEPLIAQRC